MLLRINVKTKTNIELEVMKTFEINYDKIKLYFN
jgi:hypothetical protein